MRSIRKGFDGIIQPGKRIDFGEKVKKYPNKHFESNFDKNEYIYGKIADWIDSSNRLNLVYLYEGGDLKPVDFAGDRILFRRRQEEKEYKVFGDQLQKLKGEKKTNMWVIHLKEIKKQNITLYSVGYYSKN